MRDLRCLWGKNVGVMMIESEYRISTPKIEFQSRLLVLQPAPNTNESPLASDVIMMIAHSLKTLVRLFCSQSSPLPFLP